MSVVANARYEHFIYENMVKTALADETVGSVA